MAQEGCKANKDNNKKRVYFKGKLSGANPWVLLVIWGDVGLTWQFLPSSGLHADRSSFGNQGGE